MLLAQQGGVLLGDKAAPALLGQDKAVALQILIRALRCDDADAPVSYTHLGKEAIQNDFDMVFDLLPRLKERRNQPAGTLSGGEQQMLAMGRALMCKPKMLLLDEPSMGLSPLLVKEIFKIIRQVNRNGVTVLLVEQNAKMALEVANRAYVLELSLIHI